MHRNDGLKSAQPKSYRWQIPPTPEFCHARPLFLGTAECVAKLKQLGLLHMIGSGPPRSLHPSGVQDGMDSELRIRRYPPQPSAVRRANRFLSRLFLL